MELTRLGKYKILGEIGRGTMGRVYKAHDPVLNRYVALKTLSASLSASDEVLQRFHREAQAAALLAHPNIVTVHDFGEEQGLIYIAMELLEGIDLREAIGGGTLATLDDKFRVMDQICAGLGFAHSKNVVHRDLKPANVYIQPNGLVKIVDFGLARIGGQDMTQEGTVMGTPSYMSPEQALGDKVDGRTDIFSAGVIFYQILTSHKPFDSESTPGVLYQVVHQQPTPVRQWVPELPSILVEVVEKAMAKDKAQRFQTAGQMRAALVLTHQALEAGRGPDATLAGESQRALQEATKGGLPKRPDASPVPPVPRPEIPRDAAPSSPKVPEKPSRQPMLIAGAALLVALLAAVAVRAPRLPPAALPSPALDASRREVAALTQALVEAQLQLAGRDLEDKNYRAAIARAERVLKLDPRSAEARRILETARARRDELESAARQARRAFEAGQTERASRALARVLELDPKHPVAGELTARLNRVFRTRAEEAGRSVARSRAEAENGNAATLEAFTQAVALASQAETLFKRGEFAAATRGYLESRDAFDRAHRTATTQPAPPAAPAAAASGVTEAPGTPEALPSTAASAEPPPAQALVERQFVTGKTLIAGGRAGGDLEGFDTSDVRKQKIPDLVGRIEFEATPGAVKAGEPFTVRIYLVNDGKKPVRIRSVNLVTVVNGTRAPAATTPLAREVAPLQRTLVAELGGVWPEDVSSWSLEAVVTSDRDETGTSRLTWM